MILISVIGGIRLPADRQRLEVGIVGTALRFLVSALYFYANC